MNIFSIVLFLHIVGALGVSVALGLEWIGMSQIQKSNRTSADSRNPGHCQKYELIRVRLHAGDLYHWHLHGADRHRLDAVDSCYAGNTGLANCSHQGTHCAAYVSHWSYSRY